MSHHALSGRGPGSCDHAVNEAAKHRAVIEQAKGMLMLTYRIDADTAFELLRRHSQTTDELVVGWRATAGIPRCTACDRTRLLDAQTP